MSLFSRLLRLHKRQEQAIETSNPNARSPEEDFFTEIIGHISETEPSILFDWLNDYAFPEPRQFTSVRVTTQKRFNPPTGFNIDSKLDLVMELERDGVIDLVFVESKIKSKEGSEQLPRYSQTLAEQNVTGDKWLLYVTRNFEPKPTEYQRQLAAINFKQLRWFQFYKVLRRQRHNPIIKEVLAFMEETGMSQGNRFSARDALTIQNLATATSLMDATLADEIEQVFEQITSKPKWNRV
jgi:PD-(D/E)XK nuclease superfamily